MRLQTAICEYLTTDGTATEAIAGQRIWWAREAKEPVGPLIRVRKVGHVTLCGGIAQHPRTPAVMTVSIASIAKSQETAAELAEAVAADLIGYRNFMPSTSPATSGAPWVAEVAPGSEEDSLSDDLIELGLYAEVREYAITYEYR